MSYYLWQAGNVGRPANNDDIVLERYRLPAGGGVANRREVELSLARVKEIQRYAAGTKFN
jgi:hypothetical protein